jgi:hypothetical protein
MDHPYYMNSNPTKSLNIWASTALAGTSPRQIDQDGLMQNVWLGIWQADHFIKSAQKLDLIFWWAQILLECFTNLGNVFSRLRKYPSFFNGGFELIFQLLHHNLAEVGHIA